MPPQTSLSGVNFRRLHPNPGECSIEELAGGLEFAALAPSERPYIVLNMVSTLDGRITIDGRSGPIGGTADRGLFHALRERSDAVMVGAGTARTERYGRLIKETEQRARRARAGLEPDSLAIVVSGRVDLPPDLPLLNDEHSRVVVLTAAGEARLSPSLAQVEYLRSTEKAPPLTVGPLLTRLRASKGVRSIVCEGGPKLNYTLLREGLVDELFLSLAPKLAGGDGLAMVTGPALDTPADLELVSVLEADGTLFTRYRIAT